eukprot:TRINITY_DN16526_c0_g1_i1.p1 TRINITY_DN16526_c0_g1~~TRINITY_DN16526_c0_g1_i1.p1  ORF type:complete len:127 (-),score=22.56 TRINITY_DN16526_c0_g1_i1:210-590(-)
MWVSSSAFEKSLNTSSCLDPGVYGSRVDPEGRYIKKYIPELTHFPAKYIYEPWTAPLEVQNDAGCTIGKDYPMPMTNHHEASNRNRRMMEELQDILQHGDMDEPNHIKPSDESEIKVFFGLRANES